jgi:ABC-type uncharacterized transport system fused permease/ATPase subunit
LKVQCDETLSNFAFDLILRRYSKEQALEGGFRHTHARLIAHAEEVALLGGADREIGILDEGLNNLVVTQRWRGSHSASKQRIANMVTCQTSVCGDVVTLPNILCTNVVT